MSTDTREALAALPLEESLKRAYYYDDAGNWRGPDATEFDRWHAVARAALATQPAQPSAQGEGMTDTERDAAISAMAGEDKARQEAFRLCAGCKGNGVMGRCEKCPYPGGWQPDAQPSAQGEAVAWKLVPVEPISYHRDDETEQGERCYVQLLARLDEKGRQALANEVAHGARADLAADGAVILSRKDWSGVKILRAAAQPSAQGEAVAQWMPIETAPIDGSKVLLNWKSGVVVGWYEKRTSNTHLSPWRRDLFGLRDTCYGAEPTHWMPLPTAPGALASAPAAPAQAVPLNFDQLQQVMSQHFGGRELTDDEADSAEAFARAIERAHGIKEKKA